MKASYHELKVIRVFLGTLLTLNFGSHCCVWRKFKGLLSSHHLLHHDDWLGIKHFYSMHWTHGDTKGNVPMNPKEWNGHALLHFSLSSRSLIPIITRDHSCVHFSTHRINTCLYIYIMQTNRPGKESHIGFTHFKCVSNYTHFFCRIQVKWTGALLYLCINALPIIYRVCC